MHRSAEKGNWGKRNREWCKRPPLQPRRPCTSPRGDRFQALPRIEAGVSRGEGPRGSRTARPSQISPRSPSLPPSRTPRRIWIPRERVAVAESRRRRGRRGGEGESREGERGRRQGAGGQERPSGREREPEESEEAAAPARGGKQKIPRGFFANTKYYRISPSLYVIKY